VLGFYLPLASESQLQYSGTNREHLPSYNTLLYKLCSNINGLAVETCCLLG